MRITEVGIKLQQRRSKPNDRLRAFAFVVLDGQFVINDMKVIEGGKGLFVAMPSRKLTDHCPRCGTTNHLRAKFCNECGRGLAPDRAHPGDDGRTRLHTDIVNPVCQDGRDLVHDAVICAYAHELELSKKPGYVCTYDDRLARKLEAQSYLRTPVSDVPDAC